MHLLGKFTVTPVIPEPLRILEDMAYNLMWSWNPAFLDLYINIDNELWNEVRGNPVKFLQEVNSSRLESVLKDPVYMKIFNKLTSKYKNYIENKNTWFSLNHDDKKGHFIAYFSAEYGFSDVIPIYSGGLGILSGDHCKSASDLGLPFAGIGLLYKEGCNQRINRNGWQENYYPELPINQLPIKPALNPNGEEIIIPVEMACRDVYVKVWELKSGRISVYLMDTDIYRNTADDRKITSRLYGGDNETRIQQEILLGIGGIRVLDALGIKPTVYHMNESHSAFLGFGLIRKFVQECKLSFREAREVVLSCTVFTTHTPVPAGNDVFSENLIEKYLVTYWESLGISRHEFLDMGMETGSTGFSMAVLAMKLSGHRNGVSELHGAVLRNLYSSNWPGVPEEEIPITHITNGIHTQTWMAPEIVNLIDKYIGSGWVGTSEKEMWEHVELIPEEELWDAHNFLKQKAFDYLRVKIKEQAKHNSCMPQIIRETESILDPNALTIGFARRFTSYKRAELIFRNPEQIKKILNNTSKPVQLIFAGKAHPADHPANETIKNICSITRQEGFKGKVFLIENYNMDIAKALEKGCDLWLNNPRRPLEACGSSGQKAGLNGVINLSIPDGWWVEGYNEKNGWVIGSDAYYDNDEMQDNADNESLLAVLENDIIPLYYTRNEKGVPEAWIKMMKESIKSVGYQFSSARMVKDYFENSYYPCMERMDEILSTDFDYARKIALWKNKIEKVWRNVHIYTEKNHEALLRDKIPSDQNVNISALAHIEGANPSDIRLDVYFGKVNSQGSIESYHTSEMSLEKTIDTNTYQYAASLKLGEGGEYGYSIRAVPSHPSLIEDYDLRLIRWAT